MRIRLTMVVGMMVCGLGVGWYVMAQNNGTLPTFVPGQVLTADALNTIVDQVETNTAALSGVASGDPIQVDCDAGDSLAQAVQGVSPGRTIQVSGTCAEPVTITTDRLTLDGQGATVLDGSDVAGQQGSVFEGLLTVDGAQGVVITGLTVQNSPVDGILVQRGAAATVQSTTVQDSADDGIQVSEGSSAQLTDCMVERNGEFGVVVSFNAQTRFSGTIVVHENGSHGLLISDVAEALFREGTIEVTNNGGAGILVFASASARVSRAAVTITANANGLDGILLTENAHMRLSGGALTADANGRDGITVVARSTFATGGATVTFTNNTRRGMNVGDGAAIIKLPQGPLTVQNNQAAGIVADLGSIVNLLGGTTLTDNGPEDVGPDLDLRFGTVASITGENTLGVITCDTTVLLRGDTGVTCPTP